MANSKEEKRKSSESYKNDVIEARVIANYGDPGTMENYNFDILSRYVIVAIESAYRIPTLYKWNTFLAVVARPEHLWITADGGVASSPAAQRRSDPLGNIDVGLSDNPSISGIPKINSPYKLGEVIKIKKLSHPLLLGTHAIFRSEFTQLDLDYGTWHNEGSTLPYFTNQSFSQYLRWKTLYQKSLVTPNEYGMILRKHQYEAFLLTIALSESSITEYATKLFSNTGGLSNSSAVNQAEGGYVFNKNEGAILFSSINYVDINIGNKQRIPSNECMPLVVTTPNSFPTPKVRTVGTIEYNPTYSTIVSTS